MWMIRGVLFSVALFLVSGSQIQAQLDIWRPGTDACTKLAMQWDFVEKSMALIPEAVGSDS